MNQRPKPRLRSLARGRGLAWLVGGAIALAGCGGARALEDPFLPSAQRIPESEPTPRRASSVEAWTHWAGSDARSATRRAPGIDDPRVRWSRRVGIVGYANSPLVDGDTVYITSQGVTHNQADADDGAYALDVASGQVRWFTPTNEDLNGALLGERHLYAGADDGTLYAFDRRSGQLEWTQEFDHDHHHAPVLLDGRLWVNGREHVHELDPETGALLGRVSVPADEWTVRGALSVHDGALLRTTRSGGLQRIARGEVVWQRAVAEVARDNYAYAPQYAPALVIGDLAILSVPQSLAYGDADVDMVAVDAAQGEVVWSADLTRVARELTRTGPLNAYDLGYAAYTPWVMNGVAWVPWLEGAYLLGVDLRDGAPVASVPLPDCRSRQFSGIVGVPSRGYFARHDGSLYAFVPATGELDWAMTLAYPGTAGQVSTPLTPPTSYCSADPYDSSGLYAPPAIGGDGTLYVGSGSGYLYAIDDEDW